MPSIQERLEQMQDYIKSGRVLEAMREFYAQDCAMQENANPPCVGLPANIEREKQFLAQVKEWKGYTVKALAARGDVGFVESAMDFINQQGQPVHMEQVSVTRWRGGKIAHERFYYNAGK
ncbi:MAG: nuclear transport factor 2 family protein [Phycisphaerae bacterium]|nr:nuclear transport factor 2 family protein [Phycisphaerae bacterium]